VIKRILVTGVAGFIGSSVARRSLAEGFEVVGVDDFSSGQMDMVPAGVDFVEANLAIPKELSRLPRDILQIFHLAGQSSGEISFDDPVADLQKNTVSTLNLISYAIETPVEKILYASSMSVYGETADAPVAESTPPSPLSCYGVGKLASENYLKVFASQVPSVSLRMFNVYGPGQDMSNLRQGMISIYLAQALNGRKIAVRGSLNRFRDFIYIDDVVEAWMQASTRADVVNTCINIATGVRTTVAEVTDLISTLLPGIEIEIGDPTLGDQTGIYADCSRAQELLGLDSYVELSTGLRRFLKYLQM
jgi:UDP-glucose 4-epimerase